MEQGVRERYPKFPSSSSTLESLVTHEAGDDHQHATGCLLRLLRYRINYPNSNLNFYLELFFSIRGLMLTRTALQNSRDNKGEELSTSFKRAYDTILRRHHNFAIRTVVGVCRPACNTKT